MCALVADGAYHEVDSSVLAFEIAARAAFKQGLRKANARLMEPIMKVRTLLAYAFLSSGGPHETALFALCKTRQYQVLSHVVSRSVTRAFFHV